MSDNEILEALPAAPVNGQTIYFSPSSVGFVWELQYSSRAALWSYRGGFAKESSVAEYKRSKKEGPYA